MSRLHVFLAALAIAPGASAFAQQTYGGLPATDWAELSGVPQTLTVTPPDVAQLMAEDEARNHRPLRYGQLVNAEASLQTGGTWDTSLDGALVWRMRFEAPGALSVALEFAQFELPVGGQLFVYDDARTEVRGAFTHLNHQENGGFVFAPVPGEAVTLEYVQPSSVTEQPRIVVSQLIYDYRDVIRMERNFVSAGAGEGSCLIDVNCPEGDGLNTQKRATMRTLSGGALCSAALVNNTSGDGTQYILTADHCGQSSNTVFSFNFEQAGCGSGNASTSSQVNGATVLTSSSQYDCRLMRINNPIPDTYTPYFAGWTRSTSNTNFAFAMGHPSGGPKKISIDSNGTSSSSTFWTVFWSDGYLEGGSSGGPLFDSNGRVKGPACCVTNFTCGSQTAFFGRFDRFYNSNNISQWLDPAGTNPTALNGLDPFNPGGGPGVAPVAVSFDPPALAALVPETFQTLDITGTGFLGVSGVILNGTALNPAIGQFQVLSDTQLRLLVRPQDNLGDLDLKLSNIFGSSTTQITVELVSSPTVDLTASDPGLVFSSNGLDIYTASQPGDLVYLLGSLSDVPTVIPGLVDLDLGNGGLAINILGLFNIDPVKGWNRTEIPLLGVGVPFGARIHIQAAIIEALAPALPASSSNLEVSTMAF